MSNITDKEILRIACSIVFSGLATYYFMYPLFKLFGFIGSFYFYGIWFVMGIFMFGNFTKIANQNKLLELQLKQLKSLEEKK